MHGEQRYRDVKASASKVALPRAMNKVHAWFKKKASFQLLMLSLPQHLTRPCPLHEGDHCRRPHFASGTPQLMFHTLGTGHRSLLVVPEAGSHPREACQEWSGRPEYWNLSPHRCAKHLKHGGCWPALDPLKVPMFASVDRAAIQKRQRYLWARHM